VCAEGAKAHFLTKEGHRCLTVQEAGWSGKQTGEPLAAAELEFDVLITVDKNLRYQQNMEGRNIAIVVLHSPSNRLEHLRQYFPACGLALERIKPGEIVRVDSTV
jgi:hypothetical protein